MTTADPYVCEHCDDSVPHQHVDEQPLVEEYRRDLLRAVLAACGVGVVWLAACLVLARDSSLGLLLGALAWAVATAVGLVAFLVMGGRRSAATAVIAGAIGTAAVSPILALVVGHLTPGPLWSRALTAGLGWLVLSTLVTGVRTGRLRDQLTAHTRDGEAARSAVVRTGGRPSPYVEAAWLVLTAIVLGLCVAATTAMPLVTGVLVPLNAALAVLSRRLQARATQPRAASPGR
jgi:hypothetical protein